MAHAYHHARSSSQATPGNPAFRQHLVLHQFLDQSKIILADAGHRALLHHQEGAELTARFAAMHHGWNHAKALAVARQHIEEDLGEIPPAEKWLTLLPHRNWHGPLPGILQQITPWFTARRENAADVEAILAILKQAPRSWTNTAGAFLAEAAIGTMGAGNKPIRTLAEAIIRGVAKQTGHPEEFPTFYGLAREIPNEEWIYHRAITIPETLPPEPGREP